MSDWRIRRKYATLKLRSLALRCTACLPPAYALKGKNSHFVSRSKNMLEYCKIQGLFIMAVTNLDYRPGRTKQVTGKWKGLVGIFVLIGGVCVALHYALYFETTIEVEDWLHRVERVSDAGLVQNRVVGIIVGLSAIVLGAVLIAIRPRQR